MEDFFAAIAAAWTDEEIEPSQSGMSDVYRSVRSLLAGGVAWDINMALSHCDNLLAQCCKVYMRGDPESMVSAMQIGTAMFGIHGLLKEMALDVE